MSLRHVHQRAGERGFVTTSHVTEAGVAASSFTTHAAAIGWSPRFWRVWVPAGVVLEYPRLCAAAVASIGGDVMVTGATALYLDGLVPQPPRSIELLLPHARHVAPRTGTCLHRTVTFDQVRGHHRGELVLPPTSRALADHAAHVCVNDMCRDIATALRMRRCSMTGIRRELDARKRFPGRATLRQAHGLLTGEIVHSTGERLARRLLRGAGMRFGNKPLSVEVDGRLTAEIDIPFERIRYGVEIDGPHHLLPNVAAADRARDRTLERAGWTIDRFYWFEVEERASYFVAEVQRRLASLTR